MTDNCLFSNLISNLRYLKSGTITRVFSLTVKGPLWTQWTHGPKMTLLTKSLFGFAKGTNCHYFLNLQEIQLCFYPESRFPDMQPVSSQYQNACQHPGYRINHHQHIISFPQRRHDIHPDYPEQTGSENRQQSRSQ